MSPHLEEIKKIEQLLEQENFDASKNLEGFSEIEKQDILLQKQLIEELTHLQILEELEEIHQRKITQKPFKRLLHFFSALLLALACFSAGSYFVYHLIFENRVENHLDNSVQNETIVSEKEYFENTEYFEKWSSKLLQSGLSWKKNQLIDSLEKDIHVELEKTKIKRIHIIDTVERTKSAYYKNFSITTSLQSNEILVCIDNEFFYIQPISYQFVDSLYDVWYRNNPNYKYNKITLYYQLDYHVKKNKLEIVNPDGKDIISSPSLSADGNTLYYSKKSKKGDYDIWKTERILENGKPVWQEPTEVKALNQVKSFELSPSISADGNTIYFSRNPNATGCARIYYSTKNEFGEWTEPKMIPVSDNKHINYGCDVAPYIMPDGKTLLFSAQRTGNSVKNLGLYDIYLTQKQENGKWSEMELIESISSDSTESHFTVLPKENKIYFSRIQDHCTACRGVMGHSIPIPKQLEKFFPKQNKEKLITQKNKLIDTSTGKDFELNNFTFDSNSALLTSKGKEDVERIILFMKENQTVSLQIVAHTDNEGSINYNQVLSEKRATSVCQFLEAGGIEKKRLLPIGKGESQPKVENSSKENKAQNRRVEFFIIEEAN